MARDDGSGERSFFKYLTYSEEDELWGMVCTDAGFNDIAPNTLYPPYREEHPRSFRQVAVGRTLNEFQVVYITRGSGTLRVAGSEFRITPGSAFFVFPGVKHRYQPDRETGWTEYWAGFKGAYFDSLVQKGILGPDNPHYEIGLQNSVLALFKLILEEVRQQRPLFQIKACSGILSVIAELISCSRRRAQPNQYERIVEKAKYLMEENIYEPLSLPAIAESVGVSTSRLNEIFKNFTSMTPHQYYLHIKIHHAKILLEQENLSIKEAAFRLGFEDQYYFSRLFKSKTGISPSDWKKYTTQ